MAEPHLLDRMFTAIMRGLVETGRAPHYAELAPRAGARPSRTAAGSCTT